MSPKVKRWVAIGFFVVVAWLLYLTHHVLLPFIFSGIFIYLMAPAVSFFSRQTIFGRPVPRGLSVILVYLLFFLLMGLMILMVFPPIYREVLKIATDLPRQLEEFRLVTMPELVTQMEILNLRYRLNLNVEAFSDQIFENILHAIQSQVESLPNHMQTLLKVLFSTLSTFLVIFIVTGFVLVDLPRIKLGLQNMVPAQHRQAVLALIHAIDRDLSGTIRGQLLICLVNGTLTTAGLLLLNVKFAMTIGFVAGVFSLIPVFGAVISTVPAVLIALTQSVWTALAVVGVIIIIHLIEANYLNPKILGHTVELHPAVIVFAIVVGEHFFGVVGLLFGVPVAAIIRSVVRYFYLAYYADGGADSPEEALAHLEQANPEPQSEPS